MEAFHSRSETADALDFEAFEAGISGSIVLPGSPDYDEARQVHHANTDRRPALIVRAADALMSRGPSRWRVSPVSSFRSAAVATASPATAPTRAASSSTSAR